MSAESNTFSRLPKEELDLLEKMEIDPDTLGIPLPGHDLLDNETASSLNKAHWSHAAALFRKYGLISVADYIESKLI